MKKAKSHYRQLLKEAQERNIRLAGISCNYYPEIPLQFPSTKIEEVIGFHGKHFVHRNLAEYDIQSTIKGGNHGILICRYEKESIFFLCLIFGCLFGIFVFVIVDSKVDHVY